MDGELIRDGLIALGTGLHRGGEIIDEMAGGPHGDAVGELGVAAVLMNGLGTVARMRRKRVIPSKEDRDEMRAVYRSQLDQSDYRRAIGEGLDPKSAEFRAFQRQAGMVYTSAKIGIHGHTINQWQKLQTRLATEPYQYLPPVDTLPHIGTVISNAAEELLRARVSVSTQAAIKLREAAEIYKKPSANQYYDRDDMAVQFIWLSNSVVNGRPDLAGMIGVDWYDYSPHNTMPSIDNFFRMSSVLAQEVDRPFNAKEFSVVGDCVARIAYLGSSDWCTVTD